MSGLRLQSVEAGRLVDLLVLDAVDELVIGHAVTEAANHRGHLRIEDRMRNEISEMVDDLDVLPGGVEHLHDIRVAHQREERGEVDPGCHRIDDHCHFRACHLNEAQHRPERGFAQELRIDRNIA